MKMKTFVINLNRRPERWVVTKEHLYLQGFIATRFPAIDNGWQGCRDSHLAILEKCKKEVFFFVFEDDVLFINDRSYLNECVSQLPNDWDCLFLGASPQDPQERYSDNLFRLKNAKTTHAILWHTREGGAVDYILSHKEDIGKIDDYFCREIFPKFNCFLTYPLLCTQRETGTSDTCKRSDVSTIEKNYNKYCK